MGPTHQLRVLERYLQVFLGHKNVESTRRYARLADNALLEVLRPSSTAWGQAGGKSSANETETDRDVTGGPSRTRTWDHTKKSYKFQIVGGSKKSW